MADQLKFVSTCPTAMIHAGIGGKQKRQLLWGDEVNVTGEAVDGWLPVFARKTEGWMRADALSDRRLLEIIFVDIGQGDGALVITPDGRNMLVDAGEKDNLYRFLKWRYGHVARPITFDTVVISHPDEDHYGGFGPIFSEPDFLFGTVYHNGIVERAGPQPLGPRANGMLTDVVASRAALEALLADPENRGSKKYPNLLHNLLVSGRVEDIASVASASRHLPGYAPGEAAGGLAIEVLSPVLDTSGPAPGLPWFGSPGETKNGHSVVLRLVIGNVTILLGGDLNIKAEHRLLTHYTGYKMPPGDDDRAAMIEGARKVFRADVAKACHHGSADFSDLFLRAVDPLVTVISSGDDEPHSHPRADALGAVGHWGHGPRPLIFATELARSAKDVIKQPYVFRRALEAAMKALHTAAPGKATERAQKKVDKLLEQIGRSVARYGAINLRTDGERIVMAQMTEAPTRVSAEWDTYLIEPDAAGVLRYRGEH